MIIKYAQLCGPSWCEQEGQIGDGNGHGARPLASRPDLFCQDCLRWQAGELYSAAQPTRRSEDGGDLTSEPSTEAACGSPCRTQGTHSSLRTA